MPLVEMRCDGGPRVGFGHLRRSQALALGLKERGFAVRVLPLSSAAKSAALAYPSDVGPADLLLFDLPDTSELQISKAAAVPVVANLWQACRSLRGGTLRM